MQEDPVTHAEQTVDNLQPEGVEMALKPEDFRPGESFATYFGRKADKEARRADDEARKRADEARRADDEARRADDEARKRADEARRADDEARRADEVTRHMRQMITLQRQSGRTDAEIAVALGLTVEELLKRYLSGP
jgi:DNA-directed RNA polymerase specialized sigma24 family protein